MLCVAYARRLLRVNQYFKAKKRALNKLHFYTEQYCRKMQEVPELPGYWFDAFRNALLARQTENPFPKDKPDLFAIYQSGLEAGHSLAKFINL